MENQNPLTITKVALKPMGSARIELFLYYVFLFLELFPQCLWSDSSNESLYQSCGQEREKKNCLYRMSWTDAVCGNTNKGAVWLMLWNLAHRMYLLLKSLASKIICYYFICRSRTREKILSWSYLHVLNFAVISVMTGWGKMNAFQFLKFLRRGGVFTSCWYGCECGHWLVFFPPLPCLVDNQLAQVDSKLG